jgi:glycosyltransferase involved in cell wall biosynthesis
MPIPNRIVIVLSQYQVGGAETQLASLIEHRPEWSRALDVRTVTFIASNSQEIVDRFTAVGIPHDLVERPSRSFVGFFLALLWTFRRLDPTIVHTLLDHSTGTWGRLAAWLLRVPAIMMSDLSVQEAGSSAHFALRPFLDRITRRFLPNAEAIADRLAASGVPRRKITVIPCGVDLEVFDQERVAEARAERRRAWGIPDDAVVAGYLGRFTEVKRVDVLIEALRSLPHADRPDFVALGGDGPTMPLVRSLIDRDPWLRDRCRLLGMIHDRPEFLVAIDYLVLPTEVEGLPNVILEAMAMSRPVVSTRVSDIPGIIAGAGFVAEPGDVTAMAEALRTMQRCSAVERRRMGEAGRTRVERDFDIEAIAERFWREHAALLPAVRSSRRRWWTASRSGPGG